MGFCRLLFAWSGAKRPSLSTSFIVYWATVDWVRPVYNWFIRFMNVFRVRPLASSLCGDGHQRRHVFCRRDDGVDMPSDYCDETTDEMPTKSQPCHIQCSVDCHVSAWSPWSSCSQTCGTGKTNFDGYAYERFWRDVYAAVYTFCVFAYKTYIWKSSGRADDFVHIW